MTLKNKMRKPDFFLEKSSGDVDSFIEKFEVVAVFNGWSNFEGPFI